MRVLVVADEVRRLALAILIKTPLVVGGPSRRVLRVGVERHREGRRLGDAGLRVCLAILVGVAGHGVDGGINILSPNACGKKRKEEGYDDFRIHFEKCVGLGGFFCCRLMQS